MDKETRQERAFRWLAATIAAVIAFSAGMIVWSQMTTGSVVSYAAAMGVGIATFLIAFFALAWIKTL